MDPARREAVVPLDHPVTVDGVLVERVTLQRLTGRQLLDLVLATDDDDELGRLVREAVIGLPIEAVEGMDADDQDRVLAAVRPFLPAVIRSLDGEPDEAAEGGTRGAGA